MKLLDDIIDEHFLSSEKDEILNLLEKYNLHEDLSKSIAKLREHILEHLETSGSAPTNLIATTSSNLLIKVNSNVSQITNIEEKYKVKKWLANIAVRMILSIIKQFPKEALHLIDAIKESLIITSKNFNYDYSELVKLLNIEETKELIESISGSKTASEIKLKEPSQSKLVWKKKINLGFLTTELKRKNWIKSQSEFSKLFEDANANLQIRWNMEYKYCLAYLLLKLKNEGLITPKKGYFKIAERHLVDYSMNALAKNSLKKISSKITNEPAKYQSVIDEVDQVIKKIQYQ